MNNNYLTCFLSLLLVFSCSDNPLELSPTSQYSDLEVWEDPGLIEAFVNNTYYEMPHGFLYPFRHNISCYADEIYYRGGATDFITAGNITSDNLFNLNRWTGEQSYWDVVNNCNIFFDNIEQLDIEDMDRKNRLVGEMKFLRAFSYLMLNQLWGGVPLIASSFELDDDFLVARNSYEECMKFVLTELDEAIELLPVNYESSDMGRVTKGAAMAAKSRATLYWASPLVNAENNMERWENAAKAAKDLIDLGIYDLFPDYRTLFLNENLYNQEVIWARPFNYPVNGQPNMIELANYPNGYSGYGQGHPLQNMINEYETTKGILPSEDPEYDPQNPYVNRDPRFYDCIWYDGAFFQGREVETFIPGGMDSREGPISGWNATETGYYLRKFCDDKIANPSTINSGNSPYIYFRYAEILLNYAEAMYFLGNEEACRKYINMVRSRESVMMPAVGAGGDELFQKLIHERKIELAFEEHRFFDVRRWMIAPEVLNKDAIRMDIYKDPATGKKTYTETVFNDRAFYDKNYWLPIPLEEIEKNPNITQNQGY